MKKLLYILLLLPTILFSQTLTTPTSQNIPVGVNGVGISGFDLANYSSATTYKVSLSISGNANATFSIGTTDGLTRDYGYNSWTNITAVNFTSVGPNNIENALNSITFNTTNVVDGIINLSVVVTQQVSGMYYNPTNGHMYRFVSYNGVTYPTAKSQAAGTSFQGQSGYLVTITSQDEQNFVQSKVSGSNIWIALTDEASEGVWKIDAGPENGTVVWRASNAPSSTYTGSYSSAGVTESGQYSNWSGGEPNNAYGSYGEDHAVMKWSGGTGWNDLYKNYTYGTGGYVIEYGTWTDPTQSTFNSTQQTQITFTQKEMLWVDYTFDFGTNIDPTDFSGKMYYEESANSWTSTASDLTLGSNGKVNTTSQIQETTDGKKATTTGGNVEWCVIYGYDSTNKRYRVGIDVREFPPNGFMFTWVKKLQLFDLWNGDVTFKSNDSAWAEYWIYTDNEFDFTNSNYSSYIRSMSYGNYALRAEFSFEDNVGYKPYSFIFNSPTQTEIETLIDDVVTVSDVVLAFSELTGGGLNGGTAGNLNGIQLGNADVNGDANFDFQDTYKLLQHLNGTQSLVQSTNTLVYFMKIKSKTDWDGTTTSNWKSKYNGTTLMADVDITEDNLIQFPNYKVTWLGDVNLSHSPSSSGAVTTAKVYSAPRLMSSKSETNSVDVTFDVENVEDKIIVTLTIPENQKNIIGSEFRIGFDNTRVTYDRLETNSNLQNFDAERTEYIKLGSISTDGSKNLNGGVEYKIYFTPQQNFNSILGLVSIIKSELVTTNGEQVGVRIR